MRTIGKKLKAVAGLEWTLLGDGTITESKALRKHLSDNRDIKGGIILRFNDLSMLGFPPQGEQPPKQPSAAALVALANQEAYGKSSGAKSRRRKGDPDLTMLTDTDGSVYDWIVIERLEDARDDYWFVVIQEGLPVPGSDYLARSRSEVESLMMDRLSSVTGDPEPFIVYSNDPEIVAAAHGARHAERRSFEEIVSSAGVKPARGRLKPFTGPAGKILLAIVGLCLLAAAFMAWNWWQQKKSDEEARLRAEASARQQKESELRDRREYDEAIKKSIQASFDAGTKQINDGIKGSSPADVLTAWSNLVYDTPIDHAGWDVKGFECTVEGVKPVCDLSLERGEFGLTKLLLEDFPSAKVDGDAATLRVEGPDLPSRQTVFKDLVSAGDFNREFITNLQMFLLAEISYVVVEPAEIVIPVTMPEKPASMVKAKVANEEIDPKLLQVHMAVNGGEITMTGNHIWRMEGLRPFVQANNLFLNSASIAAEKSDTGAWTLKYKYFVRSRAQPLVPKIPGSQGQEITIELPAEYRATAEEIASFKSDEKIGTSESKPAFPAKTVNPAPESSAPASAPVSQPPPSSMPSEASSGVPGGSR